MACVDRVELYRFRPGRVPRIYYVRVSRLLSSFVFFAALPLLPPKKKQKQRIADKFALF